jgi:hypothetical protein
MGVFSRIHAEAESLGLHLFDDAQVMELQGLAPKTKLKTKPAYKEIPAKEKCTFCGSRATKHTGEFRVCLWHYAEHSR